MVTAQTIAGLREALKQKRGQMAVLKAQQAKTATRLRKATSALKQATAIQAKAQAGLKALDGAIAALAGSAATRKAAPKKRGPQKRTAGKAPAGGLAGVLVKLLGGKAGVSVGDATKLVLASGYKTKSSQFQTIVNQTLLRDPRFVKVDRGVYALKGSAPAPKKAAPEKAAPEKRAKKVAKAPAKKRAARAPVAGSLKAILLGLLKGKQAVSIADATAGVLATGYKTKAKKFSLIVNQMLAKNPVFKQVGRGKYAVK